MNKGLPLMELDTPALVVDVDVMEENLKWGQKKADAAGVRLRPHTKTHRTPALARRQLALGARGITVAKLGEAEAMAACGIDDIFIANQIVGPVKLQRLKKLATTARLAVGVDHPEQVHALSAAFAETDRPLDVLIDVDTGDARTGVQPGQQTLELAKVIAALPGLNLRGIYAHEGHSYGARDLTAVKEIFRLSQQQMLDTASLIRAAGITVAEISVGATPALLVGDILPGITEIRPGTYVFLDAAQGNLLSDYSHCALTILATVTSRPTPERVVLDAGVKALTAFVRSGGVCETVGYGLLKKNPSIRLEKLSDEHGVFSASAGTDYAIGQKLEIIPNHVCPTCNLYERIHALQNGQVVDEWIVAARGKSQ